MSEQEEMRSGLCRQYAHIALAAPQCLISKDVLNPIDPKYKTTALVGIIPSLAAGRTLNFIQKA